MFAHTKGTSVKKTLTWRIISQYLLLARHGPPRHLMLVLFTPSPWAWSSWSHVSKIFLCSDRFGPVGKKEQNDNGDTAPRKWVGLTQNWHNHAAGKSRTSLAQFHSLSLSLFLSSFLSCQRAHFKSCFDCHLSIYIYILHIMHYNIIHCMPPSILPD